MWIVSGVLSFYASLFNIILITYMLTYFMLYYSSPKCAGVMIGVLMEEEVPLGLEIIGKCVEQNSKLIPFIPLL